MGSWSRINIVDFAMDFILFIIILIWKTRMVFKQKKMRRRMTKRINAVIAERREYKWYEGPFLSFPGWMSIEGLPLMADGHSG